MGSENVSLIAIDYSIPRNGSMAKYRAAWTSTLEDCALDIKAATVLKTIPPGAKSCTMSEKMKYDNQKRNSYERGEETREYESKYPGVSAATFKILVSASHSELG